MARARYEYFLVEGTYLVRLHARGAEFLKPDGSWHDYRDRWDVVTNGRLIGTDEQAALREAEALFERLKCYGFSYD